ncbi:MAG TPA: hypothetical protein VN444_04445 [Verrucomicrobiae bacterium]|nr:hypothetical protein [Verrucomicrobiae bacterium]
MTRYGTLAVLVLFTAACALPLNQQYRPIMDLKGRDDHTAAYDQFQCHQLAEQAALQNNIGADAAGGLVAGAALGALLGAVSGHAGSGAAYGSILGVAAGAGSSAGDQLSTYKHALRKCLAGRGYSVLN